MASRPPEPQVASLFATPVIVDRYPDAGALNGSLKEVILARQAEDAGIEVSNIGGWHSDRRMLEWGGEPAQQLMRWIVGLADRFTVDIRADKGKPRYRWHPEMWANVAPPGAASQYHVHPGAFWSAVYYVEDGYAGADDRTPGGELALMDPRMPAIRMNVPDLRFREPGREHDEHERFMRPESGRVVIFPAWLNHGVRLYRGERERISVAVNLSAVPIAT